MDSVIRSLAQPSLTDGYVCTSAELSLANADPSLIVCLTRGRSIGLALIVFCAAISILSASGVLVLISRQVYIRGTFEPMLMLLASLFFSEVLLGVGNVMSIKWVITGKIVIGELCTAQGALKHLGVPAFGLASLLIAAVNFVSIWYKIRLTRLTTLIWIGLQWLFVILLVAVGLGIYNHTNKYYYTPSELWCWLGVNYHGQQIEGEYMFLWIALFGSIVLYLPLFLWYQGLVSPDPEHWYGVKLGKSTNKPDYGFGMEKGNRGNTNHDDAESDNASSLNQPQPDQGTNQRPDLGATIWYPILSCIIILPLSVVRLKALHNQNSVSTAGEFVGISPIALSGALNAALYVVTRRRLLWGGSRATGGESAAHALFHVEEQDAAPPAPVVGGMGNVQSGIGVYSRT